MGHCGSHGKGLRTGGGQPSGRPSSVVMMMGA